ncbi:metal-dependent hydrolase [Pseudoalteromonas rubra]|uniref:metal-dependent hydrolase n=1 Tax=Pseudoalteromonas rubra TaxID=43658 RepID=UPI000F79F942|nr:metal-dependent hydrolase [Pseudoalteromonas rubra]
MTPSAHLMMSWLCGASTLTTKRERILITVAGLTPDLDGAGLLIDWLSGTTRYYQQWHHIYGHNLLFAIGIATCAGLLARTRRGCVWLMSFIAIHLHLFTDLIGSKGPDAYQWPIQYFYPFNNTGFTWQGQWALNAWQNQLIWLLLLLVCIGYIKRKNISFFELFGDKLDSAARALCTRLLSRYTRQ